MRLITINRRTIDTTDPSNSVYVYNFPVNHNFKKGDMVAVSAISLWYSNPAISPQYFNNQFVYYWINGSGVSTTHNITIPTGTYDIPQLNFFLQQKMIENGHYLVNDVGDYVYYLELQENSVVYGVQLNTYPIPTSLPLGWTNPASMPFPPTSFTPSFEVLNGNEFGKLIGFNAGVYPSLLTQTTNFSKTSDFTPQVSPVNSYTLSCNLVRNKLAIPAGQIFSFAPDNVYGSLLSPQQKTLVWNEIVEGSYSNIQISITDQLFRRINFIDTNNLVQLAVWRKEEDGDFIN